MMSGKNFPGVERHLVIMAAAVGLWQAGEAGAQTMPVPDADAQIDAQPVPAAEEVADIIVTATKRSERVRDISGSVTAFDERGLEALGAQSFADYLTRTPGVIFNATVPGNSTASIRGVATTTGIAQAQGTTGYFINDVPLTDPFYSGGIPDIDSFDVDNIAIMRGPQGTLFGSSSMGGAINYQAARPDLARFDAHARGTIEDVRHGEAGFNANMMMNAPLVTDTLAIRGVYGRRRIAGFVDNIGTGQEDSNRTDIEGGRVLATFAPAAGTTLNYLFLTQTARTQDAGSTQPSVGAYAKDSAIPEAFRYRTTIHNIRLDQELGFATLTATGTLHRKRFSGQQDYSGLLPASLAPAAFLEPGTSNGETVEVRLASPTGRSFEYLIGLFNDFTRERVINQLVAPNAEPAFGTATLIDATVDIRGRESALFGEASYRPTDTIKLTAGGRLFRTRLNTVTTQGGPLSGPTTVVKGGSKETGFSPKASITWQPDDNHLVYALVSRGFRFGGPNIARDPTFAIPTEFDSDSLTNYEIGARMTLLDRRLLFDGTLYWVDWSDIQVTQKSPGGFTYTGNAGRARNRGVELSATYRPTPALTLQGSATYLDAMLRRDFASAGGVVPTGSRLPGASRWQVSDSIIYAPQASAIAPTLVFSHRYVSAAPGELTPAPRLQGGYNLFDLRAGVTLQGLGITAFVNNVTDKRGVSQAATGVRGPVEYLVRPRTIGLTLDYKL